MKVLWLIVFLVACAAPSSTEYRRGVLTPPPAPTRPGVGAPVVGQPGRAPAMPRSPYTRVLPQTPETMRAPGIWAAKDKDPRPELLDGAYLPLPPDGNPTYRDRCAKEMSLALMISDRAVVRRAIDSWRHQCMAARLWSACMEQLSKEMPKMGADEVVLARVEASREFSAANAKKQCGDPPVPDIDVDGLVRMAVRQWMAFPRR